MHSGMTLDEAMLIAIGLLTDDVTGPQCAHETLESRKGACDGGVRCTKPATCERDGIPLCNQHGRD